MNHAAGLGPRVAAFAAIVFGLATVASGGRVLFGGPHALEAAGHVVPFVLWFNFLAGFAYVTYGIGSLANARLGPHLALLIAAGSALVLLAFVLHAASGGAFELRTAVAMTTRVVFWAVLAFLAWTRWRRPALG
jgi:hypothetical protein